MKNNIFNFATSELSQDAVICWCLNWFNDDSIPKLKKLSTDIIKKLTGLSEEEIHTVCVKKQLSAYVNLPAENEKDKKIAVKIDVLLIVNRKIAVIIEDKTFTSEHSGQIARYKDGLKKIIEDGLISAKELDSTDYDIVTVYWKTGFFNDYDRAVNAQKKIFRKNVISLLSPYKELHIILKDYLHYLSDLEKEEQEKKQYWMIDSEKEDDIWHKYSYLSDSHIGQYELLRSCFPLKNCTIIKGKFYEPYQVYSGTSFGRPWTQMIIKYGNYPSHKEGTKPDFCIFWRVDSATKGPYVSLRLYDDRNWKELSKEQKEQAQKEHSKTYGQFKQIIDSIIDEAGNNLINIKELSNRNNENYKEASFFLWNIDKELKTNKSNQTHLIESIRYINAEFLNRIKNYE